MPKLKLGTLLPTDEEDKVITRAARSDPDAKPFTEAEWKASKSTARMGGRPPVDDPHQLVSI